MNSAEDFTNPYDLTGRSIVVTGASSGIGRDTAVLLSRLGGRIILTARNEERLAQTASLLHGTEHRSEPFDLTHADDIPKWLARITAETGPLHGIVHAAGKQAATPARFLSDAKIDDLIKTNLSSALMLARAFTQKNCHAPGGSLVFLSSIMALAGKPALSVYAATKGALISMTKSLAVELAPQRLRVNCVAPGFVDTEMLEEVRGLLTDDQMQALENAHPLGFGTPRDVAHAIAFLLADTARWITGSTLVLDGGYTAQ